MKKTALPSLVFLFLIITFFSQILFYDAIFIFRDFSRYFYPLKEFCRSEILHLRVPFWNPYLACGEPLFANPQANLLYPPSLLVYLLPYPFGFKLFLLFHVFIAMLGTYLLTTLLGVSTWGGVLSGVTFGLGGFVLSCINMPTSLCATSWMPFSLFYFLRATEGTNLRNVLLLSIFLSLQFLGGEPTQVYLTTIFIGCASLFYAYKRRAPKTLLVVPAGVILFISLCAFQVIPFLEFVFYSNRAKGIDYEMASAWSLHPVESLELFTSLLSTDCELIHPNWRAQEWLLSFHFGSVASVLFLIALLYSRRRYVPFFSGISLVAILLSFGDYLPIYKVLYRSVPFLSSIRYPVKFLGLACLGMSVLSGVGFDLIKNRPKSSHLLIWGAICGMLSVLWAVFHFIDVKTVSSFICGLPGILDFDSYRLDHLASNLRISVLSLLVGLVLVLLRSLKILRRGGFAFCLVSVVIMEVFLAGVRLNPVAEEEIYKKHDVVRWLEGRKGMHRILLPDHVRETHKHISGSLRWGIWSYRGSLTLNTGLPYRFFHVYKYGSIFLQDSLDFLPLVEESKEVMDLLGVRYIISIRDLQDLDLVYRDDYVNLYENHDFLPRAFFVNKVRVVKDREKILRGFMANVFNPRKEVILEQEIPGFQITFSQKKDLELTQPVIAEYNTNYVKILGRSPTDCILFLSDVYYPGWQAYIDGREVEIYRANYLFRAVYFPKGRHIVEFRYRPRFFFHGLGISGLTILFIFLYFAFGRMRRDS